MTMRIVILKEFDDFKVGSEYNVERTLGVRRCESGHAEPYTAYVERLAAEDKARKKKERDRKKAEKLLADKEKKEKSTAVSKTAKTRTKSVKK